MTQPSRTPNPATTTRPQRSSTRVAHKRPLAWLPWLALLLLLLLLALVLLLVRAAKNDNDAAGTTGAGTVSTGPTVSGPSAEPSAATGSGSGTGTGSGTGALSSAVLAGLSGDALVGGGSVDAGPASATAASLTGTRDAGTAGTVLFAEGSASLNGDAQQVVSNAVTRLRAAGVHSVEVVGYTDVVAGAPVNDPLSQERAAAVAAALRNALPGVTVTTTSMGQNSPIASNDTEQGRQQNRRAAILARG